MKKIFITLFAFAALLTSCDMDTTQPGVLDDETALNDVENIRNSRNFIYSNLRSCTTGAWIYDSELQMDQFLGLTTNGNRGAQMANGQMNSSNSDVEDLYNGMYVRLANANYFLQHANAALEGGSLTDEEKAEVARYVGEVKFARAFYNFWLMDHFCQPYEASKGDTPALGICIKKEYNPSGDSSTYPGRSTLNETLAFINEDLTDAYNALKAYEDAGNVENCTAGAIYLSSYTVLALQARIALVCGNYDTAVEKSQAVIANTNYQLATGTGYVAMWQDKNVDELIFSPYVNASEAGAIGSTNVGWNYWVSNTQQADYIPTFTTLASYYSGDIRFSAFFKVQTINVQGGQSQAYIFLKYPGNDDLISSSNEYKNNPKPFRLSEQYLILAEAAMQATQPKTDVALNAIRAILSARFGQDYSDFNMGGTELLEFIREERSRELLGEGFRMSDLRRWKVAWTRDADYDALNPTITASFLTADKNVKYSADDYRYTWPIPSAEMEVNPQLKGQQNPNY